MRAGKRRSIDPATESHELTALNEDIDDAGDDDNQGQENGQTALLGNNYKSKVSIIREETAWVFIYNILIESWQAIKRVDELYILIPMLNNLKGNLEMNLSSRLSTAANIGDLDDVLTRRSLVLGNLALLQVQALIVSAIAAVLSFVLGLALSSGGSGAASKRNYLREATTTLQIRHKSGLKEFIVLLTSSMTSASMSSVVLDNITPPIASCLGDLLTLCIIGLISAVLVRGIETVWPILLLIVLIGCCVSNIYLSLRNKHVRPLVSQGWIPLLGAIAISSGTGMVLDKFVNQFEGYGLLSIVIGGLPGSVGSVLVSRLSTSLHAAALHKSGVVKKPRDTILMLTLFGITLPVLFLFLTFIQLSGWTHLPLLFLIIFVPTFCITFLWNRKLDPDSYAMPIQSSAVDLIGQLMLVNYELWLVECLET
ncbi:hypothetical protein Clacol_006095 [Clathrus columnatus]|uniref:SLC41A/MgtE integral membrane domain-containing protein n=1 Tax=Clathrus columnatus TaxID=1419009 RepID=A0AAV5ADR8_9AGAM|nr:hypothetical protein Clacol_006095 [Clathrus columnatus]